MCVGDIGCDGEPPERAGRTSCERQATAFPGEANYRPNRKIQGLIYRPTQIQLAALAMPRLPCLDPLLGPFLVVQHRNIVGLISTLKDRTGSRRRCQARCMVQLNANAKGTNAGMVLLRGNRVAISVRHFRFWL